MLTAGRRVARRVYARKVKLIALTRAAGLMILSVLIFGCGNGTPKYDSTQAVVDALAQHGIVCSNLKMEPTPTFAVEQGSCLVGGTHELIIAIHASKSQRDKQVKVLTTPSSTGTRETVLVGDDWLVNVAWPQHAQQVRAALGGEIVS
jgi:hypothetical protein